MIVSEKYGFVYASVPKAGSTSIMAWVRSVDKDAVVVPGHPLEIPEKYADLLKLSVVRNPYDRVLSIWHHCTQRGGKYDCLPREYHEFGAFLDYLIEYKQGPVPAMRTQEYQLSMIQPDHVFKIEYLTFLPRENRAFAEIEPNALLTDVNRTKIRTWCANDFVRFGYRV